MRRLLLALSLLATAAPALAVTPDEALQRAVDLYIRPVFANFSASADMLESAMAEACASPGEAGLAAARDAFRGAVLDFSHIEFLKFGPLVEESRLERLLFWPDRKGVALRQVQAILADRDETATSLDTLRDKSVAVQGLTALEYVLHGTDADSLLTSDGGFRCRYGATIAEAISATAAELDALWQDPDGIALRLAEPDPANADYRSVRESLEVLVGSLAHGVEALRDQRLLPFMGRDGEAPKPRAALFWRSGLTINNVRAAFAGMRDLLDISQIGLATSADNLWVDNSADFEFGNAMRAADAVTLPVDQALKDPGQKKALDYLVILTGSLGTLVGENLPAALGLSVGFSSLDGD